MPQEIPLNPSLGVSVNAWGVDSTNSNAFFVFTTMPYYMVELDLATSALVTCVVVCVCVCDQRNGSCVAQHQTVRRPLRRAM